MSSSTRSPRSKALGNKSLETTPPFFWGFLQVLECHHSSKLWPKLIGAPWISFPDYFWHQQWPWQKFLEGFCLGTLDAKANLAFNFLTEEVEKIIQQKKQSSKFKRRLKITSWPVIIYVGEA
jgi:hypothetical protein